MKRILVIHTGGTISMTDSHEGVIPTTHNPIATQTQQLVHLADIINVEIFQIPSPHMTIHNMKQIADMIKDYSQKNIDGVVITHGTDTLEETAYFLDLVLDKTLPIVITGAMRSSNEIGADGLYNFIAAVRVASHNDAKNKGVLIVFNDEIHTAENITKTHTSNTSTFQSPNFGPIGMVTKHHIHFHHLPIIKPTLNCVDTTIKVGLIKAYCDMDANIFDFYMTNNYKGLVIEALGQGNLPHQLLPKIKECLALGLPIVLVSRCFNGIVAPIYAYEGGGKQLADLGVIFSNGLNGPKARLKLLIALSNQLNTQQLINYFS